MQRALTREDFVWLAGSLCQLNRIPFDPQLLLQRFPAPHSVRQLIEAAASLGFKTGELLRKAGSLGEARLPCVGFLKSDAPRPAILMKADASRVLYFRAGEQNPCTASFGELDETFEPELLLVRHESAASAAEAGDGAPAAARFGFRWFWAELLRHRKVWRDVLSASLFIQLIALATPLGTQVIIDKVVVHQTTSTLVVIAAGLAMFLLFNAAMSWLRQGIVKEILVREGERVKEGQVLIRMDAVLTKADVNAIRTEYDNRRLALRRIDAQLSDKRLERRRGDPPALYEQIAAQYETNIRAYENALAQEKSLLDKARYDLQAAQQTKLKLEQVLPHYVEQE